jgi:hypothetical protein
MWKTFRNEKSATRSVSSSSTFRGDRQIADQEAATSSATAAAVAAGRRARLLRVGRGERLHLRRLWS